MIVYLCGPMAENTPEQANGWRQEAASLLGSKGFTVTSPMRGKGMLESKKVMGVHYESYGQVPELTPPSIFARDQFDVRHADIILANMTELGTAHRHDWSHFNTKLNTKTVLLPSIGSDFEIAWAFMLHKPVVLIAPDDNPYAHHPFLKGMSSLVRFDTMEEGISWIARNFNVYL